MKSATATRLRVFVGVVAVLIVIVDVARHLQKDSDDTVSKSDLTLLVVALGAAGLNVEFGKLKISQQQRDVAVESLKKAQKSKGTPVEPAAAAAAVAQAIPRRFTRVLWIDDEPQNNVEETLMLTELGFGITNLMSVAEAEPFLRSGGFDLVISSMTQKDDGSAGLKVVELAKASKGHPRVIIYRMKQDDRSELAKNAGASDVVTTPVDLLRAVRKAIAAGPSS
jgi:CheY-like chemotaxis protein